MPIKVVCILKWVNVNDNQGRFIVGVKSFFRFEKSLSCDVSTPANFKLLFFAIKYQIVNIKLSFF